MLQNDGNTTNEKCLRTRIPGKTIAEPPQSKNPVYLNYFSEVFPQSSAPPKFIQGENQSARRRAGARRGGPERTREEEENEEEGFGFEGEMEQTGTRTG